MYTGLFDVVNSILQSILIIVTINYCSDKKYKRNKIEVIIWVLLLAFLTIAITNIMGNYSLSIIIMHIVILAFSLIPYRKDKLTATIGFSIVYAIISILSVLGLNMSVFFSSIINVESQYEFIVMLAFM